MDDPHARRTLLEDVRTRRIADQDEVRPEAKGDVTTAAADCVRRSNCVAAV